MQNHFRRSLAAAAVLAMAFAAHGEVNSNGAFTQQIDIDLPAAVGGMQPDLSLSYDSQAGDGLVGVGWQLNGFPAIVRMSYGAGINYNGSDTFYGPGGRLINFNGSHAYRTEDESWAKYVPYNADGSVWTGAGGCGNGPCYWRVTAADGEITEFGATGDSRIEAVGKGGAVREWALSRVTDTAGNFYTAAYQEHASNGDYFPVSVTYNQGNGRSKLYTVELAYEIRSDVTPEFSQSARVRANGRLSLIAVKSGGQLLRQYRLAYEYGSTTGASRLITLQEYGRDGDGASALPAQRLRYQEGSGSWAPYGDFPYWASNTGFVNDAIHPTLTGDWNGDGKMDIGRVHNNGIAFQLSTGTSWQAYADGPAWGLATGYTDGSRYPIFTGDWNGDGKTDIGRVYNGGIAFQVSTGSGWLSYATLPGWGPDAGFTDGSTHPILVGDWNGDGRTDIGRVHNFGIAFQVSTGSGWQTYANGPAWSPNNGYTDGSRYPVLTGDWNGDGKTDFGRVHNGGIVFQISTGAGWQGFTGVPGWGPDAGFSSTALYPILTGDWNGDGKTDIGRVHNNGIAFVVSSGADWQGWADGPPWHFGNGYADANRYPLLTGDWNGDGRTDIGRVHNNGVAFQISADGGWRDFAGYAHWGLNEGYADVMRYPFLAGDWTGEGKSGLGRVHNNGITFITRAGAMPDLLSSVTNALGGAISIAYLPATQVPGAVRPDVATCTGLNPSLCGNASASSVPLVTSVAMSDGRGSTYSTRYEYSNYRYLPGVPSVAQSLGFSWTKAIDAQLGSWVQTVYRQDAPYHGRIHQQNEHAANGSLLERTQFSYSALASPVATRLIRTTQEDDEAYEFGAFKYRTRTTYGYDAYGNATLVSTLNDVATAADDIHTSTSYINDSSRWRIGLPYLQRTCVDAACTSVLQQTRSYYDNLPTLGQSGARSELTRSSAWRSDTSSYVDTAFTYDSSGNLLARTNAAGIEEVRNEFDADSGFLRRIADASGNTATNDYDPLTGELTAVTDANGNTTSFRYDVLGRRNRIATPHDGATLSVVEHSWSYSPNLYVQTVHTDRGAIVTTKHLDGLARAWKTTQTWDNGALLQTEILLDGAGREFKACAAHLSTQPVDEASCTTTYFDAAARVVRVDSPRSRGGFATTMTAYDGYRVTTTDPALAVAVTDYDPGTRTATLTQSGGLVTRRQKDVLGREINVTDPAGNVATYAYNSLGWKLRQTDPVSGQSTFRYDALGQLIGQTDAAGATTNMYYDASGRLLRTDYAPLHETTAGAEDTVMKYDYRVTGGDIANGRGRLVRVSDRSGTAQFAYDAAGRVRTGTKTIDGVQYAMTTTFDRAGKRTSLAYPNGAVVRYEYATDAGNLSAITLDGVDVMRYAGYNERGAPTSLTYGNRINDISLTFESSTGALLQHRDSRDLVNSYYEYDERGMLVGERDLRGAKPNGDTSKAYAYDPLRQLTGAAMGANAACSATSCAGSAWSKTYSYDNTGRVLQKDGRGFAYDAIRRFQLTRIAGEGADRTYDPVGRLLSKTSAQGADTYLNGADGFLHEHRRNGALLHRMTYDYQGNRAKKEYLGTNPQTTWDLGSYKIVHDRTSGKYYHTLYVTGLHGSRIAHRTVEKPGMVAAAAWSAYQDRTLASMYEPASLGGFLPWATHRSAAAFKALLNDLDGARGTATALASLAMAICLITLAGISVWQLFCAVIARWRAGARPKRRAAWFAPAMLGVATAACVGNYETEPPEQATADSIGKDGRYGIIQALGRGGTNQPVPGTFYYLNSPLGSTSVMFDAQGTALLRLEYFPDGAVNTAASLGNYIATHTYGQKEYDKDLEAYYNAFRYYDAQSMRFTTPDAIKDSGDFLVHNTYAYTRNNPVNYTDPSGFRTMQHDGGSGGSVARVAPRGAMQIDSRTGPVAAPRVRPRGPSSPVKKTAPFNGGPDGGSVRPVKRPTTPPPGRAYLPADGVRGYGGSSVPTARERDIRPSTDHLNNRRVAALGNDGTVWQLDFRNNLVRVPLGAVGAGHAVVVVGGDWISRMHEIATFYKDLGMTASLIVAAPDGKVDKQFTWYYIMPDVVHHTAASNTLQQVLEQNSGSGFIASFSASNQMQTAVRQFEAGGGSLSRTYTRAVESQPAMRADSGGPAFPGGDTGWNGLNRFKFPMDDGGLNSDLMWNTRVLSGGKMINQPPVMLPIGGCTLCFRNR